MSYDKDAFTFFEDIATAMRHNLEALLYLTFATSEVNPR